MRLVDGPEPEGAPVVHDHFQATVGTGGFGIEVENAFGADAVFFLCAGLVGAIRLALPPHRQVVFGAVSVLRQLPAMLGPELIDFLRVVLQGVDVFISERFGKGFAPVFYGFEGFGRQAFGHLVFVIGHAGVGQQEVVNLMGGALRTGWLQSQGGGFIPEFAAVILQSLGAIDLPPGANK